MAIHFSLIFTPLIWDLHAYKVLKSAVKYFTKFSRIWLSSDKIFSTLDPLDGNSGRR